MKSGRELMQHALVSPAQMAKADALAMAADTPGSLLMERAGKAVADTARRLYPHATRIAVLVGPGNNGGDGYVAARHLGARGVTVAVFAATNPGRSGGDAAAAAALYMGKVLPLAAFDPGAVDLVIDAIFGAGLARAVPSTVARVIADIRDSETPVLSIDLPSGISGSNGAAMGEAVLADVTVTFFRRKPGHLLHPGKSHCGQVIVADIGIPDDVLDTIEPHLFANVPGLWKTVVGAPKPAGHKYGRGHAAVFSGPATKTGAARLAAGAALRAGAGLVSVFAPGAALQVNAMHLTAVMLRRCEDESELSALLIDERLGTFVLGPGFGAPDRARAYTAAILAAGRGLVLDADGLTAFASFAQVLFDLVRDAKGETVLTPHEGEFAKLFPDIAADDGLSKPDKAILASQRSGAIVILKGADSVIAAPNGRATINETGTPWLATAGSGDVLAGIVAGLLAQGSPAFEAAAAAVWMHGKAAERFGPGLIAEDLADQLPAVWRAILGHENGAPDPCILNN